MTDTLLRNDLQIEIRRLQEELQRTMTYVTRDEVEALILADRARP